MANLSSCPPAVKSRRRRRGVKEKYRLRNWPAYNAGLKQRGSLTVWCSPDVADGWYYQGPNKRGAQYTFSDVAIQPVLTLGMIYHLPLRQAEGFTDSVLVLMGLALRVPDYSTLMPKSNNMATQKPSRCPAMRPSEPSAKRADKRGKKPAAIIDDLSSKPTSDAIKRSSATPSGPAPYPINKPKPGSAVPCSTGCYNSLNPKRIP